METINPIINFGSPSDAISTMGSWANAFFQGMLPVGETILGILIAFLLAVLLIRLFSWGMSSLHHTVSGNSHVGHNSPASYRPIYKNDHEAGFERI
jgi:hypothetical protein